MKFEIFLFAIIRSWLVGDGDEVCPLVGSFSEMEYFVKLKQVGIWSNVTRNRAKLGKEWSHQNDHISTWGGQSLLAVLGLFSVE